MRNDLLNQDCTRKLLQYLATELKPDSSGRKKRPVKLRKSLQDLPEYSPEDIYQSATYLADRGFISLVDKNNSPRFFVISGVSAEALDYLQAIEDETIWCRLKSIFPDVFKATLTDVLTAAVGNGLHHFFGK